MRRPIDTAPRDGEDISVEITAGAVEAARWSSDVGKWAWKHGTPTDIAPIHSYPETEDGDPENEPGSSVAAAVFLVPIIFIGAALLGSFDPFNSRVGEDAVHIDVGSILSLDRYAEIKTDSQTALQQETTRDSMLAAEQGIGRRRLIEDTPRSEALGGELAEARKELGVAKQRAQAAEAATEQLRQSLQQELGRRDALVNELAGTRRQSEKRDEQSRKAADIVEQQREAAAQEVAGLQQSLLQEQHRSALLERQVNAAQAATAAAAQEYHDAQSRAAALASELAGISREPLAPKGAALEQSEATVREIAGLREALQDERRKNADLIAKAKASQAAMANAEQQGRALEDAQAHAAALTSELAEAHREMETRSVQMREAAAQQKQAADREIADLRQSLGREPSRTEARTGDRAPGSSLADMHIPAEPPEVDSALPKSQNGSAMAVERPAAANETEARLIPRARALLDQGDIGAARIVLELAAQKDIAKASFMLAETYDPAVLSAWGTYGTRGEVARARELYAKAQKGGILGAKERLDALLR
ncbi:hypothetical protein [Bradyrhizobium sp. 192]|uniref:hypothetical protein n=1 Tax=Bradyrhizobium sp. 192 TaxID=2782660 RepID=UPI001FFFF9FD|nr:hypothetical protein [Bradyrhizobium sp. 192]UPJ60294.1 hypothetical protein IVB24_12045 [Bradyrhizobium sp. 192]